jgi:coenzyme F420-reducing hydrogenase gamma subunit
MLLLLRSVEMIQVALIRLHSCVGITVILDRINDIFTAIQQKQILQTFQKLNVDLQVSSLKELGGNFDFSW